ncbi:hypothetical protein LCGC14_0944780 [marine sediment metagenome]|uniref:Uncharacterized protein n=1 Tax=marine sediment metagenome TaxID=412755 RepID=A0A0F9RQE9_9ZZZZ|nr:hypothetical protein [Desulfobacterales bacterium]
MYAGANWIKRSLKKEMSPLGEAVANLLGRVFRGIYHLNSSALNRVNWDDGYFIKFIFDRDLATVDFNSLTALIVYAHDEKIRVSIEGCGPRYMRMLFHQRESREGDNSERCPTIENHIEEIRSRDNAH